MPIVATPIAPRPECAPIATTPVTPQPVACDAQTVRTPPTTTLHKRPLLSRRKAVTVKAGQAAVIEWQFVDETGKPIDLQDCLCGVAEDSLPSESILSESSASGAVCNGIKLRFSEVIAADRSSKFTEVSGTPVDLATGRVSFALTARMTRLPGIYAAEAAITIPMETGDDAIVTSNRFHLAIEPGLWGKKSRLKGIPTFAEVRMRLRDSHAAESFLLDERAWDDAEIAQAMEEPIRYWNEIPPNIGRFTTSNLDIRHHYLDAVCALLFRLAAEHHRRNNLQYSAAGVSVDDMNKEQSYMAAYQMHWSAWQNFVMLKKAALNAEQAFGALPSEYSYDYYWPR